MKVAICEDEPMCVDLLDAFIKQWARENGIFVEVLSYGTAEQFLFDFGNDESIDLIFLDIKMGKMNGIELAHKLRSENNNAYIVFTTDSSEYVFEGYNVSALNYLIKPIEYNKCCAMLERVRKLTAERKYYLCKTSESLIRIPYEEILFIEMHSHNATINTSKGKYITRKTMTNILLELDSELFMKCHKSCIVNIQHISSISQKSITLSKNISIDVSMRYVADINKMYVKYYSNRG